MFVRTEAVTALGISNTGFADKNPSCGMDVSFCVDSSSADEGLVISRSPWLGAGNFSYLHRVQNGPGAHTVSYPMGTRGSFPGNKAAGA
jgi:hypothetical protein